MNQEKEELLERLKSFISARCGIDEKEIAENSALEKDKRL
jgi:hypothetical protein